MTTKTKLAVAADPMIGIVMGSKSDWATMQHAAAILEEFDVAF
jgi:5-(carboxyamino)imidazole ribonucleotide mutase